MPIACAVRSGTRIASTAALLVALAAALPARAAGPETYTLDPVHTRVLFAIEHAGFSRAMGTVSGSTGELVFDRDDWRSAHLDVRVPLQRLDLGDAKWNEAATAANLLDAKRHPEARFVSASVEPKDADHATVCGDLTLRGVTKPLCMDVTLNALKRHPMPPFRRTAGFSATATLSRADFGMNSWKNVIGDTVELRVEAEATRARNRAPDERVPADETPADETPADETPADETPADSVPADSTPPDITTEPASEPPSIPPDDTTP